MRTTVTIPDEMLADLMRFTEASTRTEAVNRAIVDWVRRKKIEELRSLRGKLSFDVEIEEMRALDIEEQEGIERHGDD